MNYGYNIFYLILSTAGLTWFYSKKITWSAIFFSDTEGTNSHQRLVLLQHNASDLDLASIWLYTITSHNLHAHLGLIKCQYLGKCLTTASKQQVRACSVDFPSSAQLETAWSFEPGNVRWMDMSWVLSLLSMPPPMCVRWMHSPKWKPFLRSRQIWAPLVSLTSSYLPWISFQRKDFSHINN